MIGTATLSLEQFFRKAEANPSKPIAYKPENSAKPSGLFSQLDVLFPADENDPYPRFWVPLSHSDYPSSHSDARRVRKKKNVLVDGGCRLFFDAFDVFDVFFFFLK